MMSDRTESENGAKVGSRAPNFSLPATRGPARHGATMLDDYCDRWLVLLFYPRDFSLVCPTELTALSGRIEEFKKRDCDILAVSTDSIETHDRWLTTSTADGGLGGLRFPLASDESGNVARAYGVYLPRQHVALRGLFIIDPNGVLQYQAVHNLSVGRRSDEILRVLDALQTGGLCAENWTPGQLTLDPVRTLGPESIVGHYRIEAQIGSGSFGAVFRAVDLTLERRVALKVIRPDILAAATALLAEARAAAALNHANICTVYAVDNFEGVSMIVMEYVEGQPLAKLLADGGLPPEQAAGIGARIAEGMSAAHARGIVHGDLKPANIMTDGEENVKVMDFGLARRRSSDAASESVAWSQQEPQGLSGTPSYMSPEQSQGRPLTPASDVFTLGLILYELVTGRQVIQATNIIDALRQIDEVDPERFAAETPEPFRSIIRTSLAHDARDRQLTMEQIAEQLWLAGGCAALRAQNGDGGHVAATSVGEA